MNTKKLKDYRDNVIGLIILIGFMVGFTYLITSSINKLIKEDSLKGCEIHNVYNGICKGCKSLY